MKKGKIFLFTIVTGILLMWNGMNVAAGEWETADCGDYGVLLETQAAEEMDITYADIDLTPTAVYERIIAMKEEYPEGMSWTNANFYAWNGGYYSGGYGCAGFAFLLSDAAFGDLPARFLEETDFASIRVGDILRINNDGHSVIVLEVYDDYVVIAEGNYNSSIHWGRVLTKSSLESGTLTYIMTRYPVGYEFVLVEEIEISESEALMVSETRQLAATVYPSNATQADIAWESSNEQVVTVSESGLLTAVSPGTAIVYATAQDGSGVNASCAVTVIQPVSKIELNQTTLLLKVSETYTLEAKVLPDNATNKEVYWISSNEAVATVDQNGLIKAVGPGTATISAAAQDESGVSASCAVTVVQPVSTIELNETALSLKMSETYKLEAKVLPDNATNKKVYWTSSNEAVVTVDQSGLIKAVGSGTATVWATAQDGSGVSAGCEITAYIEEGNPFYDVLSSEWYYPYIKKAYDNRLMDGTGTHEATGLIIFQPEMKMTRAQFVQVLYSMEGKPEVTYTERFTDIPDPQMDENAWYSNAVLWAAENGITSGRPDGTFGKNEEITREQMALMLMQYASVKGYDVSNGAELDAYIDVEDISEWAVTAMRWAVDKGIMSGTLGGNLNPKEEASRAEGATMLNAFYEKFI